LNVTDTSGKLIVWTAYYIQVRYLGLDEVGLALDFSKLLPRHIF